VNNYDTETIWSMCLSKKAYPSERMVALKLASVRLARRNRKKSIRRYACPICHKFHLTKK
jgi:hypothetical protein